MASTHAKPVVGLVGAPGSGKSMVARQFAKHAFAVIDADAIARAQLEDPAVKQTLRQWWGGAIFAADGSVDRAAVAKRVFSDPEQRHRLEGVVHPRVHAERERLRAAIQADPAVRGVVEDCPLLLESGLGDECDWVVFVEAPRAVRLARVVSGRGWDAAELDRREKSQMPLDRKRSRADYVVKNDADEAKCFAEVSRVISQIFPE